MAAESVGHGSQPMGHGAQVHGEQGTWQLGIRRTGSGQQHGHRFYSFPLQNPDLLNKWLAKMKRKGFVPTEFPAVFGTLFGYLFPGGLVRKVHRCGEVPQRRAHVTSRIAALADNMAAS